MTAVMLGAAFLIMAAGAAEPSPGTAAQPARPIVVEGNRKVCHEQMATGSILPKRVCKTANQWEQDVAASQRFADQRAHEQTVYQQTLIRAAKAKEPN